MDSIWDWYCGFTFRFPLSKPPRRSWTQYGSPASPLTPGAPS
jgi:hypothetical protein